MVARCSLEAEIGVQIPVPQQVITEKLTIIEEKMLGCSNWATESMSFGQRVKFYRDTGEWPGVVSKQSLEIFMQSNINLERVDGKNYCVDKKLTRAKEAGLDVK